MLIYNLNSCLRVDRISERQLRAECTVLASDHEARGWIVADLASLAIESAGWAQYRSPGGEGCWLEFPELAGVEAFLHSGPRLREIFADPDLAPARELISECIRGVVQAETFFYQERGYAKAVDYDNYWEGMYLNACRYYSNLDQVEKQWLEYVGYSERPYNLFNRFHTVIINREDNLTGHLVAAFVDSFHELNIELSLNPRGLVTRALASYNRAPDKVCFGNVEHMNKFLNQDFLKLSKRDLASLAGGGQGCNHLVDILDMARKAAHTVYNKAE